MFKRAWILLFVCIGAVYAAKPIASVAAAPPVEEATVTSRFETTVAQTTRGEAGDLSAVLVDASTRTPLATMNWRASTRRLEWTVADRGAGSEAREDAPSAEQMNREIARVHDAAWRGAR